MNAFLQFSLCCFLLFAHLLQAQSLAAGDLLLTGINSDDPDQFCFVTMTHIPSGTTVYFTDCGWDPTNGFRSGEGLITYTTNTGLPSGTWVNYPQDPGFSTKGVSGFFGLSTDGDQLYCFVGSWNAPQFICAMNLNGSAWATEAQDAQSGAAPPLASEFAPAFPEVDNIAYRCTERSQRSVTITDYSMRANWISDDQRLLLPPPCTWEGLGLDPQQLSNGHSHPQEVLQLETNAGYLYIPLHEAPSRIQISNLHGIVLWSVSVGSLDKRFSLLDYPSGVYIFQYQGSTSIFHQKILIQ